MEFITRGLYHVLNLEAADNGKKVNRVSTFLGELMMGTKCSLMAHTYLHLLNDLFWILIINVSS